MSPERMDCIHRIGVLALQGGFAAHLEALETLGVETAEVRRTHELEGLSGLIIPGGETTTLLNLMRDEPWFDALKDFHAAGGALMGTCAGAILLAREVKGPEQPSLGLLDAVIRRNAYGRQVDSFEGDIEVAGLGTPLRAVFIRAPRFVRLGLSVEVLARHDGEPVMVRAGRVLAATFHPELTDDRRVHAQFVDLSRNARDTNNSKLPGASSGNERRETEGLTPGPAAARRRVSTC